MALGLGVRLACQRGFNKLIVECDSELVLSLIRQGESLWWESGPLVFYILDLVAQCDGCVFLTLKERQMI